MEIQKYVETCLPELVNEEDKLEEAVSFLKSLGANIADDLKLSDQNDLMPFFNLIQSRKLSKSSFQGTVRHLNN